MQSELQSSFHGLMGSLRGKWKTYWEKRAAINELAKCDPSEIARLAEDLGVSSAELRFLAASDKRAAELLMRRLQALQVDPKSIDPAVMRDLQLRCAQCESKKRCARNLANKPSAASRSEYCPNEQTIEVVKDQSLKSNTIQAAWPRKQQSPRHGDEEISGSR
jgi:uncharacterized protein YjiS (DUF1127 family)